MRLEQERSVEEKTGQTVLMVEKISLDKGEQEILRDINFTIKSGEKVALVGSNGAGKTSLLKCIIGEEIPNSGKVFFPRGISYSYVPQAIENVFSDASTKSVLDYFLHSRGLDGIHKQMESLEKTFTLKKPASSENLLRYGNLQEQYQALGGWSIESEAKSVLTGIGLGNIDLHFPITKLSGGEKTKVFLAQALLSKKDVLLLDEPTNHIDQASIDWLGGYLKNYKGAVVVVSHKPELMDKFVDKVYELTSNHLLKKYPGNYADYQKLKSINQVIEEKRRKKQEQEIARLKNIINKLKAGSRASTAKDREKKLVRMNDLGYEFQRKKEIRTIFEVAEPSGSVVLTTKNLLKRFGEFTLDYSNINLNLQKGEKVGIMGPVGAGKTTLLKIIAGVIEPDEGEVILGSKVKTGYYSQEMENLNPKNSVLQELEKTFPYLPETKIRTFLGSFLFKDHDVFKKISVLSFGERSRLALAKLALYKPNFLILDEPSNHLDLTSKEKVAEALNGYSGTMLLVSHDEQFLEKIGLDKIIFLPEGKTVWLSKYTGSN